MEFSQGELVKLVGKTRHGLNRIDQHGSLWRIERIENPVGLSRSVPLQEKNNAPPGSFDPGKYAGL